MPFDSNVQSYLDRFDNFISDDLNTAEALVTLEKMLVRNQGLDGRQVVQAAHHMNEVLGLRLFEGDWRRLLRTRPKAAEIANEEINELMVQRMQARAAKDFATSDRIRDGLIAKGVEVMDGDPLGWDWKLDV